MSFLQLLGILAAFNAAYLALQLATLRGVGIGCDEVGFGVGPRLFTVSIAGVRWIIKPLPISSYVLPRGMQQEGWEDHSRLARCAVAGLPWLVLLAAVAALAGVAPTMGWVSNAVPQLFSPVLGGTEPLLHRLVELLQSQPTIAALALSAKLCAVNLLPLPSFAGGRVIMELLPITSRAKTVAATLSMWLTILLAGAWALATVRYVL